MLAGASLGDDALLAHAAGEQRLADGVVDLVRAGVVEVLALEEDARTTSMLGEPLGEVDRARPTDEVLKLVGQLGLELGVRANFFIGLAQLGERPDQSLGDEHAAVGPEVPPRVRQVIHLHCEPL